LKNRGVGGSEGAKNKEAQTGEINKRKAKARENQLCCYTDANGSGNANRPERQRVATRKRKAVKKHVEDITRRWYETVRVENKNGRLERNFRGGKIRECKPWSLSEIRKYRSKKRKNVQKRCEKRVLRATTTGKGKGSKKM